MVGVEVLPSDGALAGLAEVLEDERLLEDVARLDGDHGVLQGLTR